MLVKVYIFKKIQNNSVAAANNNNSSNDNVIASISANRLTTAHSPFVDIIVLVLASFFLMQMQ